MHRIRLNLYNILYSFMKKKHKFFGICSFWRWQQIKNKYLLWCQKKKILRSTTLYNPLMETSYTNLCLIFWFQLLVNATEYHIKIYPCWNTQCRKLTKYLYIIFVCQIIIVLKIGILSSFGMLLMIFRSLSGPH